MKCFLLVTFMTILVVQAHPGKGKHRGPEDPSVTGHPYHERPTLAPGETRPPHGKHHSRDDDHTHDPLQEKKTRPPGWNPGKKDRPTLPPGMTFPPRKHHGDSHDRDKEHHGEKPTLAPGQTFPPRKPPPRRKP